MISVEEARRLLGPSAPEADADVAALRDLVAGLAELVLDSLTPRCDEAGNAAASAREEVA